MTSPKLSQFCITFAEQVPITSYFSFPKKRRGKEKKGKGGRKKRWEKWGFSPSLLKRFSSPLLFFGKEKYDVTGTCSAKVIQNWDSFHGVMDVLTNFKLIIIEMLRLLQIVLWITIKNINSATFNYQNIRASKILKRYFC